MSIISDYWFSSQAGGPGPGPGPGAIGESLRFRKNQVMTRTTPNLSGKVWCCSFWVKSCRPQSGEEPIFVFGTASPRSWLLTHGSGRFIHRQFPGGYEQWNAPVQRRDPSGWYHCYFESDASNNVRLFVNGTEQPTSRSFSDFNDPINFGHETNNAVGQGFDGYIASIHLLDGEHVGAGGFARFDNNGVWIPRVPVRADGVTELTSEDYGAGGFHLSFGDPFDIGADVAPLGTGHTTANNFTPINFNTDPARIWSEDVSNPAGGFSAGNGPAQMFDGSTVSFCQANNAETYTFTPNPEINYASLQIWEAGANWSLNGGATVTGTGVEGFVDVDPNPGTLTSLAFIPPTNLIGAAVRALRINGNRILIDSNGKDFDIMIDSPSNNVAIQNQLQMIFKGGSASDVGTNLSDGNLTSTSTNFTNSTSTFALPNNGHHRYYAECVITTVGNTGVGICDINAGNDVNRFNTNNMVYGSGGTFNLPGGVGTQPYGEAYGDGDVIGLQYNSATRELTFFKNGTSQGVAPSLVPQGIDFCIHDDLGGHTVSWNYGQKPWLHEPAGVVPFMSRSLAPATIANGRDHFAPATYPGTGSEVDLIGTTFQPDLAWIKCRNNDTNHVLVDSVRGAQLVLESNEDFAEVNDPESVKQFLPNGLRLGTSNDVNNGTPGQNLFIAWMWRAGGAAVANNDGDIAAQVSANRTAGFSIVTYSGNNAATASIGHGLNSEPEFVIVKARNATKFWTVYHASISKGTFKTLELNTANKENENPDNEWFGLAQNFNSSTFTVGLAGAPGASNSTNATGVDYVAYCWHSIPGYSSFGSFRTNADANGPFVALSFKPAWVMVKWTSNNSRWDIFDSSRDLNNPTNEVLMANEPAAGNTGLFAVDFLSNGFKVRDSGGLNAGDNTVIYAAFAEHPTGGNNVAPATAR